MPDSTASARSSLGKEISWISFGRAESGSFLLSSWKRPVCRRASAMSICSARAICPAQVGEFFFREKERCSAYLFSPCAMFWEDVKSGRERRSWVRKLEAEEVSMASLEALQEYLKDTHPVLAEFGKLARAAAAKLEELSVEPIDAHGVESEDIEEIRRKFSGGQISLLEMMRADMLFLSTEPIETVPPLERDGSFELIGAGSSRLREVQILKDGILRLLHDKRATPSEILVLSPDIAAYEPLIRFVFQQEIPYRISPSSADMQSSFFQAMRQLFLLARKDWEADVVFELFEQPAFHGKQGFDKEELAQCLSWMKDARVRQKWDGANGFVEGMNRMMRGLIFLLPEDEGLPRVKSIDWGGAELLDRLMRTFLLLKKWSDVFQSSSCRLLGEWVELIERAAKELFEAEEGDLERMRPFLRKAVRAAGRFAEIQVPFSLIDELFERECFFASGSHGGAEVESIQFVSLRQGAVRPAKAIFLIGMESGEFPRPTMRSTFDWKSRKADESDLARHLLLEALFAAEDKFSISYCHRSFEDGQDVDLLSMVQEWLEMIDRFYPQPKKAFDLLMQEHPSLPYHPSYFQKGTSFSRLDFLAARRSEQIQESLWTRELPAEEIRSIDLEDLSLAAANPWKYFLKTFLGTWLKDEKLFSDLRLKDFDFSSYARKKLVKEMFQSPMEDILQRRKAELPPGAFRGWAELKLKEEYSVWKTTLAEWGLEFRDFFSLRFSEGVSEVRQEREDLWEAPPIELTLSSGRSVRIVGTIELASQKGLGVADKIDLFEKIAHRPEMLALQTVFPIENGMRLFSFKREPANPPHIQTPDPKAELALWVEYAEMARRRPSPFIKSWAQDFLEKPLGEWQKKALSKLNESTDLHTLWMLDKMGPIPFEEMHRIWHGFLTTLCQRITS